MQIEGATAFVTGANRGFGRSLAAELLRRGATVYAGARRPETVDLPGAIPVRIDITDPASVAAAAEAARGVTLLVNNAGTGTGTGAGLLDGPLDLIRLEMETHYFGTLAVTRAFAPQLARAPGDSAVLNVLSVLSWITRPGYGAYSAAKAAAWSLTNALRAELAPQGTQVSALHVAFMDTDLVRHVDAPKSDPDAIARVAIDGVAEGRDEILADDLTRRVKAGLGGEAGAPSPAPYPAAA